MGGIVLELELELGFSLEAGRVAEPEEVRDPATGPGPPAAVRAPA